MLPSVMPHSMVPMPAHAAEEAMQLTNGLSTPGQPGNQFMLNNTHPGVWSQNAAQMATLSVCDVSAGTYGAVSPFISLLQTLAS